MPEVYHCRKEAKVQNMCKFCYTFRQLVQSFEELRAENQKWNENEQFSRKNWKRSKRNVYFAKFVIKGFCATRSDVCFLSTYDSFCNLRQISFNTFLQCTKLFLKCVTL